MRAWIALVILASAGCTPAERRVEWGYRFVGPTPPRGSLQLVAMLQDGCEADARVLEQWVVGTGNPAERRSQESTLALAVQAVAAEAGCPVFAAGCAVLGEGRTVVELREADLGPLCPAASACSDLVCESPRDAGMIADAQPRDAGTRDASLDAGVDAGPPDAGPRTACDLARAAGAWACDDFEGAPAPGVTLQASGAGRAERVTDPRSRAMLIQLTGNAPGDTAYVVASGIPSGVRDIWMRAWVRFEALPDTIDFTYLHPGPNASGVYGLFDDSRRVAFWLGSADPPTWHDYESAGFPLGWTCVEQHVRVADAGYTEMYADDTIVRFVNGDTASGEGPYSELRIGLLKQRNNVQARLQIDDLAISPTRLGCP